MTDEELHYPGAYSLTRFERFLAGLLVFLLIFASGAIVQGLRQQQPDPVRVCVSESGHKEVPCP